MKPDMFEVTTTVRMLDSEGAQSALAFVRSILEGQGFYVVMARAENVTKRAARTPPCASRVNKEG